MRNVLTAIGNTPLVELSRIVPKGSARVFVKVEAGNPTGSYKDRMALAMIEGAERRGELRPGMRVVEYTGGSTGSSLAMVCAVKGYEFIPVTSDAIAREKIASMRAFGSRPLVLQSESGKISPQLMERMLAETRRLAAEAGTFYTDQFNNPDAPLGYTALAHEVLEQLGAAPSAFCAAVGTGGLIAGVSPVLKEADRNTRIIALEPAETPFLTTGKGGPHTVDGTGAGFWPAHLTRDVYDEIRTVPEAEARAMARRLAREEGIFAGTSSGLNTVAALRLAAELGADARVVTVAVDSGLKYLAGDLFA